MCKATAWHYPRLHFVAMTELPSGNIRHLSGTICFDDSYTVDRNLLPVLANRLSFKYRHTAHFSYADDPKGYTVLTYGLHIGSLYDESSVPLDDDDNLQLLDHQGPIAGSRFNQRQPSTTPSTPGSLSGAIPLHRPTSRPTARAGRRQSLRGRINEMLGRSPRVVPGQENEARIIYINNPDLNEQQNYLHNRIFTGKYTAVTFLPKFLYEEFSKYANLFFLFISGIQVRGAIKRCIT